LLLENLFKLPIFTVRILIFPIFTGNFDPEILAYCCAGLGYDGIHAKWFKWKAIWSHIHYTTDSRESNNKTKNKKNNLIYHKITLLQH
jgi:hypothetical protein